VLQTKPTTSTKIIKPRALRKGDTVGIIAPSNALFEQGEIEFTYQWLQKLGLKWKLGKHVFETYSEFAGSDEARLEDFMTMWCDAEVDGILPLRGGNGAARLLPWLDFELIGKHPKLFVGYSDLTALLVPIHQRTGLVTFYGPMATSFFKTSYSYHYWTKAVMSNRPIGLVTDPLPDQAWKPAYPPPRMVIAEGRGRGRLMGGCLTLIKQLQGTPFEADLTGKIVFLEDLHEEPHQIDRMITQLLYGGKLQKAAGILIGECINCKPGESQRQRFHLNNSVESILRDRLGSLGIPVVYGMRFGHGQNQFTLPIGAMATLEAKGTGAVKFKIEENGAF
jgi:muramoyltetrapeptide carboxypeptidase